MLNLAAAVLVAIVLVAVALTTRSGNPPAIAEFAPQAQQIKQAPSEQTGSFGNGAGGSSTPVSPSPQPSPAQVPPQAILLRCVGDPPRQTEDPQSPPCTPYWQGNNGGATWKGVTGSQITIEIASSGNEWAAGADQAAGPLQNFFNKRFELYGRTVNFKAFKPSGGAVSNQHADAATVNSDSPFGVVTGDAYMNGNGGANVYFNDDLARDHIVSIINEQAETLTEGHLDSMAPYEWSYFPPLDTDESNVAEMICRQLKGHPPRWAGAAVAAAPQRVFGVIQETVPDGSGYEDQTLLAGLAGCGIQPFVQSVPQGYDAGAYNNTIAAMNQHHVTSIVCLCLGNDTQAGWLSTAESQHYEPEWLIPAVGLQDMDDHGQLSEEGAPAQAMHMFGITTLNKMLPIGSMPWWWAVSEGNPSANQGEYAAQNWYYGANYVYLGLLELVSGIQLAGPNLTPQTFERGLQKALFPNPGAAGPPLYQATVGFPGSHTMVKDVAEIWWGPTAQSTYWNGYSGGAGAWCWLDRGRRFQVGSWPSGEPAFFSGPCQ